MMLIDRWAVRSQQGSRHNALLATTELNRRRIERDEVEAYLAAHAQRRAAEQPGAVAAVAAAR